MADFVDELGAATDALKQVSALRGHRYDQERCEEAERFVVLYRDGRCDEIVLGAALEGLCKTGIALTQSEDVRNSLIDLLTLVVTQSDGVQFFGPPTPPRTTVDDRLVSISSRYVSPKTGVNVVVDDGSGRLLMVQRADRGQWALPGGYTDVGLSPAEVAIKEAFEETGLTIQVQSILGVADLMQCGGQRIPQYVLMFHARATGGQLAHHPEEALGIKWFEADEIPRDNLWEGGIPWLDVALDAVQGKQGATYFDPPRPGFAP